MTQEKPSKKIDFDINLILQQSSKINIVTGINLALMQSVFKKLYKHDDCQPCTIVSDRRNWYKHIIEEPDCLRDWFSSEILIFDNHFDALHYSIAEKLLDVVIKRAIETGSPVWIVSQRFEIVDLILAIEEKYSRSNHNISAFRALDNGFFYMSYEGIKIFSATKFRGAQDD